MDQEKVEAPPGFEPGVEVLQTSALPLGDGADRSGVSESRGPPPRLRRCGTLRVACQPQLAHASEDWSGKRDSNPRLRPWQGRTLPLSYSRPNLQSTTRPGRLSTTAARRAALWWPP